MNKRFIRYGLPAVLASASVPAWAAIDVSSVTTLLSGDGTTAVTAIGLGVLALLGVVMVFKFVRRAM
jgi:hypothetical protein